MAGKPMRGATNFADGTAPGTGTPRQLSLFPEAELALRRLSGGDDPVLARRALNALTLAPPPGDDDLNFLHSGLCQTALPHARPDSNTTIWVRRSNRCTLIVEPGSLANPETGAYEFVGVPYGSKARLIMIYLQTEGMKSRLVPLGKSMSAWMRSLGISVTGGSRGTIHAVKEQVVRIAACNLKLEWTDIDADGAEISNLERASIVKGLRMWAERPGRERWPSHIELTREFHEHLQQFAQPLDRRAIAALSGNSLSLDLYTTLAYRLPRLGQPVHIRWSHLHAGMGADVEPKVFAHRLRKVLPDVLTVYPDARVEVTRYGLSLLPSKPAVPRSHVSLSGLIALPESSDSGGLVR